MDVCLKILSFGKSVSEKGRVRVVFPDGKEYSLDASRIKRVLYLDDAYYAYYETEKPEFYKPYVVEAPKLASELSFRVREERVEVCSKCGGEVEWDADEPYCPRCGWSETWAFIKEVTKRYFELSKDEREELEEFAEKLLDVKCEFKEKLYSGVAGGFRRTFPLDEVEVRLFTCKVEGVAIVEDPVFVESHYDELEEVKHAYEGKYAVVMYDDLKTMHGVNYALLKYEGEPKLDLLKQLVDEKRRREEAEEERAKALEEARRREREEKLKKFSDEKAVISEILSNTPSWADGALVIERAIALDGDYDVIIEVFPIKKSKFNGDYYYSPDWRKISTDIPDEILRKYVNKVVTRDSKIVDAEVEAKKGKYVSVKVG
jgi:DNA-directed RNA polymerase subunit RPC12/RpoP